MLPWLCLGQGADLHMALLMPMLLTISFSSKSRLVLLLWCRLTWVVPDKIQEGCKTVVYVYCFARFLHDCKASLTECSCVIQRSVQLHTSYCSIRFCARLAYMSVWYLWWELMPRSLNMWTDRIVVECSDHWLQLLLPFNNFFSRTTWVSWLQKGKPFCIIMKQEMMDGSDVSWTICRSSAPHSRQITMPAPHYSIFLQTRCSFWCPTNSVEALKACNGHLLISAKCPSVMNYRS